MSVLLSRNCFKCCQNFTRYPQRVIQTLTAYYADQEVSVSLRSSAGASLFLVPCRQKSGKDKELSSLFQPVISSPTENSPDDINVGEELSGQLDKGKLKTCWFFFRCSYLVFLTFRKKRKVPMKWDLSFDDYNLMWHTCRRKSVKCSLNS